MKMNGSCAWIVSLRNYRFTSRRLTMLPMLTLLITACFAIPTQATTAVGIAGVKFVINGVATYPGTHIEGLLMNSRMINAIFDDENPSTVGNWAYPDTGSWDPQRNTNEFIAALPSYAAKGLKAFTLGMQGGNPFQLGADQPWLVSAFNPDGSLKQAWLDRADRVIRAADRNGMVVILQYFYQHQEDRFINDAAVLRAADSVTDWLLSQGYQNVLIETNNESTAGYSKAILRPANVHTLIARVQSRSGGRLKVSVSFRGGVIPPDAVIRQSDYIVIHGNHQTPSQLGAIIDTIKAKAVYRSKPKPIVVNEDSTSIDNLNAAVDKGVSWGYLEGGLRNYNDGFQYLPVNWTINTANKRAFFDRVSQLTSGTATTPQTDVSVTSTDSPDPVSRGANVTYTITVSNAGASDATGVTLTDTLPTGVLFVSASTGCAELGGVVTCNIGGLVTGANAIVEIVVAPTADGVLSNAVRVTGNEADANPVNNTATEPTTVNIASTPLTDLSVNTIDLPDPATVGSSLTYTITVANPGPDNATGVTFTDSLPAEVAFGSASAGCTQSGGVVVCNVGGLIGGSSRSSSIIVTPSIQGTISNTAQVSGNENDPDTANNSDLEQTTVSTTSALICGGRTPTIIGTANSETIAGTAGADIIHGLGGADVIRGGGGKDIICGGDGKDRLFGDTGTDDLDGGAGVDSCDGGAPISGDIALNCEQTLNIP